MMNYLNACEILELEHGFDIDQLKQQYRIKALRYHPDKNMGSPEATEKFQKINESYEYLKNRIEFSNREDEPINLGGYQGTLYTFIHNIMKKDSVEEMMNIILQKITNICEKKALTILENIDKHVLIKINEFIRKYKEAFHFSTEFFDKVDEITKNKYKYDECIILHPTIDNLLNDNIYRLRLVEHLYNVPLWHNELLYDHYGNDIYVKCYPILPENMSIDLDNNLHIDIEYRIIDIFEKSNIDIIIGKKVLTFNTSSLHLSKTQTLTFSREGISKINTKDVYDVSNRANIILHITLI